MIKNPLLFVAVLSVLFAGGCASLTPTDRGVLGGGAIGAGTGAIIGNAVGNPGAGAAIGAAVGGISGGLVGHGIENSERRTEARIAAAQAQSQIGIAEVIHMAQNHVSDPIIITQIRSSGSAFHLSGNDVLTLKQNGVSDAVVQEMLLTAQQPPRRIYSAAPVYAAPACQPVYVVEPAPPPVSLGVGFGYTRFGGRCCR